MNGVDRLFSGLRTTSSGLMAERTRIDVIAENISNARTTQTPEGGAYRRKTVIFEPIPAPEGSLTTTAGVRAKEIVRDMSTPFERILEPNHPDAGPDGMVEYPNVNTILEMADLITAMRSYEANLVAQEGFVQMAQRALEVARS